MLYASAGQGERVEAFPGGIARCPLCDGEVRARCGQVNAWHWAHVSGADCDTWAEPETEWHRAYKRTVPLGQREVRMGSHRADLVSHDGFVVELQHSSLPAEDIQAREQHYQRMVWLFDARDAYYRRRLLVRAKPNTDYVTFRWKQPRRSIVLCHKRVLLDLGLGLVLSIRKIYPGPPFSGWGHLLETIDIWRWLLTGTPPRPVDGKRHDIASLADRILQYGDYLAEGPLPSPPEEIGLLISAALIPPGKRTPSEFQATIQALTMIGSCPPGLSHLGDNALHAAGTWCGTARIQVTCPHCGHADAGDLSPGQDVSGTGLWHCRDCRQFCVLDIPAQDA
jgi:competence protein CoiA